MQKKIMPLFLLALFALFPCVFAQELDIQLRHFKVTTYGFEEFDSDKGYAGECAGSNPARLNGKSTRRNQICVYPDGKYDYCEDPSYPHSGAGQPLYYGQDDCNDKADGVLRGYTNRTAPDNEWKLRNKGDKWWNGDNDKSGICWANPVYVTRGMVQETLEYNRSCDELNGDEDAPEYIKYAYCATPRVGNGDCYGRDVNAWFRDGGDAKRTNKQIPLKQTPGTTRYLVNYDYNTYDNPEWGNDNGWFPLDNEENTWGKNSLNVWCPDLDKNNENADYQYTSASWYADCQRWRSGDCGGPRNPGAAACAVGKGAPEKNRHAYSFSAMGIAPFKYQKGAGDKFNFIGDDDMWIFVDGKLAADLGGVHLAAPAQIDLDAWAEQQGGEAAGWTDDSDHIINFFFLDRQTDGMNFKLDLSISKLQTGKYGAPKITKATTIQDSDGSSSTIIYVNTKIDLAGIREFYGNEQFPIVMREPGKDYIWGYKLESIEGPENKGSEGFAYTIKGQLCKTPSDCSYDYLINSGDSLSFNIMSDDIIGKRIDDKGFGFKNENLYIKSESAKTPAILLGFGENTTRLAAIVFDPIIPDNDPYKPPFDVDFWFGGGAGGGSGNGGGSFNTAIGTVPGISDGGTGGKFPSITSIWDPTCNGKNKEGCMVDMPNGTNNKNVSGFGTTGTPIPPNRAGELILTTYPNTHPDTRIDGLEYNEWIKDKEKQKLFGLPPSVRSETEPFGVVNPTEQRDGGYMFVKNGFPNESSVGGIQVAPTRCTSTIKDNKPKINCLNFSLVAKQPFQLAVTVFDQLGNFVTQYRETVSEQEFRSVVQGPTFMEGSGVEKIKESGESCKIYSDPKDAFGKENVATTNGLVKVNVNIYPFSANGRRFGNGVYILKIDRVDLPYNGCMTSGGNAFLSKEDFTRYHADAKFGWMRGK